MNSQPTATEAEVEEVSWVKILSENERWVRRVLKNRLSRPDEVDEVFQEIGLAISRTDQRPGDLDNPIAWLYRVAIRQVLQFRRRTGRYRQLVGRSVSQSLARLPEEPGPLSMLIQADRAEALRSVLNHLNETDREILLLKYSENWSYAQLAERLGVSMNTIEHRLVKAKRHLRKLLTNRDGEVKI